jgi:hypothetical protein
MWSRKGTPVSTLAWPVPSRLTVREILVSAVSRRTVLVLATALMGDSSLQAEGKSTPPCRPVCGRCKEEVYFRG